MASSQQLISSSTLGSSAATVTFSSIPNSFQDLLLVISAIGNNSYYFSNAWLKLNSQTSGNTGRYLQGMGSSASSSTDASSNGLYVGLIDGNIATANSFGSSEVYIPNYNSSTYKVAGSFSVSEINTNSNNGIFAVAMLASNTAAVTSLTVVSDSTFATGSSFYLYGIKGA